MATQKELFNKVLYWHQEYLDKEYKNNLLHQARAAHKKCEALLDDAAKALGLYVTYECPVRYIEIDDKIIRIGKTMSLPIVNVIKVEKRDL